MHEASKVKGFAGYDNVFRAGTAISTYLGVNVTLCIKEEHRFTSMNNK